MSIDTEPLTVASKVKNLDSQATLMKRALLRASPEAKQNERRMSAEFEAGRKAALEEAAQQKKGPAAGHEYYGDLPGKENIYGSKPQTRSSSPAGPPRSSSEEPIYENHKVDIITAKSLRALLTKSTPPPPPPPRRVTSPTLGKAGSPSGNAGSSSGGRTR